MRDAESEDHLSSHGVGVTTKMLIEFSGPLEEVTKHLLILEILVWSIGFGCARSETIGIEFATRPPCVVVLLAQSARCRERRFYKTSPTIVPTCIPSDERVAM